MASSEKRCLYEVLGLRNDCTPDEIRSAYKKMAVQRHPDKVCQSKSNLSHAEATASFQELVNAYEVLSDPKERAWYDSHRSQILFSDLNSASNSVVPDLFSYFSNSVFSGYSDSGKGFYKVYKDVFDNVYGNELNFAKKLGLGLDLVKEAPVMGNLESPYSQVMAFYNFWSSFCTVMDFCWVDQYDVMAGPNRKSRRVMEDENIKLRKKAKREYNETVRGLALFVKKRDKRVIDMQVKKGVELEKKREEEREKKRVSEREKLERAMAYEEPDWARVEDDERFGEELEESEKRGEEGKELYCVVCGKKFKSEKQWKNHEQSKKHKEKVAELRGAFANEFKEEVLNQGGEGVKEEEEEEEMSRGDGDENGIKDDLSLAKDDVIDELDEQFKDHIGFGNGAIIDDAQSSHEGLDEIDDNADHTVHDTKMVGESTSSADERSILEAMLSGRKNRKKASSMNQTCAGTQMNNDGEELDTMVYDTRKSTRRNKGKKGSKAKKFDAESTSADVAETNDRTEENNGAESLEMGNSSSHSFVENKLNGKRDYNLENDHKMANQIVDRKGTTKDTNAQTKNSSKGRKSKATTKSSGNLCDTCGEEFESRNRLHKHLGDTGHSTLKYR